MKRILLVEDNPHLAEEITDVLRLEGFQVAGAISGFKALELLFEFRPDLIITDLLMPGMDGFELIQKVRSTSHFQTIPVIILSARTSKADMTRGKEVGADNFIQKPCKAHELIASITSLIGR